MGDYSNEFLLHELKSGEERAFDYIFRKYYKGLCAQAVLYINDLDTAQYQVQECFVKLWEKRSELGDIQNLAGYLSFMVRNQCIDYLRKAKMISKVHEYEQDKPTSENSTENELLLHEFEEKVVVALSNLPERCRMAFEYSRFENHTYPEIAKKMNISVKAVEALIGRALKSLRTELKDYLPLLFLLFRFM